MLPEKIIPKKHLILLSQQSNKQDCTDLGVLLKTCVPIYYLIDMEYEPMPKFEVFHKMLCLNERVPVLGVNFLYQDFYTLKQCLDNPVIYDFVCVRIPDQRYEQYLWNGINYVVYFESKQLIKNWMLNNFWDLFLSKKMNEPD